MLHSDAVFGSGLGFRILSGDKLASCLAISFRAERIIMGIDVDDLSTADLKRDMSTTIIRHCTVHELTTMEKQIPEANNTDVTGSGLGKITGFITAIEKDVAALIMNVVKANNVYKALRGKKIGASIDKT